jgi:hypothetical protein
MQPQHNQKQYPTLDITHYTVGVGIGIGEKKTKHQKLKNPKPKTKNIIKPKTKILKTQKPKN